MPYNIITCGGSGWVTKVGSYIGGSSCISSRIGLVILFFIIAITRKWGGEELGLDFNFLFALILGLIPYLIVITLFGNYKLAMFIGIVGMLIGGYGLGLIFGGSDEGY